MLHMILGILKIIGILLGMAVLLLLAVLLALLFVPVRYRLAAKVQPERYEFSLRGSWLLHIVSASVTADPVRGRVIAIRLFGIRLPLFRAGEGGKLGGKAKKVRKARKEKKKNQKEKQGRREESDSADRQKDSQTSGIRREAEQDSTERRLGHNPEPDGKGRSAEAFGQPEQQEQQKQYEQDEQNEQPRPGILEKIWFSCRRICDKIGQMIQAVRNAWRRLLDLRRCMAQLGRKLIALLRRPGELLEFLEEYEAREIFGGVIGHLAFLALHYKPRRIRGYLRFGTGNPATTGQLAGLVYLLLPARADRFEVLPEFNETIFETDTVCSGHIRALHVLRVLWRGFRDKKLRRMINKLRKRGDS